MGVERDKLIFDFCLAAIFVVIVVLAIVVSMDTNDDYDVFCRELGYRESTDHSSWRVVYDTGGMYWVECDGGVIIEAVYDEVCVELDKAGYCVADRDKLVAVGGWYG